MYTFLMLDAHNGNPRRYAFLKGALLIARNLVAVVACCAAALAQGQTFSKDCATQKAEVEKFAQWVATSTPTTLPFNQSKLATANAALKQCRESGAIRAEKEGSISFEVVSNGMTGEEWIKHLEANGVVIGDWAKALLQSDLFTPTNGVRYQVRILKWDECGDCDRVQDIMKEAQNRKLSTAPVELACLIRDRFKDGDLEKMGLSWIVVAQDKFPSSLGAGACAGKSCLSAYFDNPGFSINYRGEGFAFTLQ